MQQMLLGQQGQAFGQSMTGADYQNKLRQQAIAEESLRRGMPLSELNALLTGQQVATPGMPSFNQATAGQAPNLLGAAREGGDYALQAAKLGQSGGTDIGGLIGSLGGAALSNPAIGTAIAAMF